MSSRFQGCCADRIFTRAGVGLCALLLAYTYGCADIPGSGPPPDNGNVNGNMNDSPTDLDEVVGNIHGVATDRRISALEPFISILYNLDGVPDGATISGFYTDAEGAGDRRIIAEGLHAGSNQAFDFDPAVSGSGSFLVGVIIEFESAEVVVISSGIIQVEGPPDPIFIRPTGAETIVVQGADVVISFDAGDPEGVAQWRLFLLDENDTLDGPADQLGSELAIGSGNIGSYTLSTDELTPGEYELGLSATDSGDSIAKTVDKGNDDMIVTFPSPLTAAQDRRVIRVLEPGSVVPPSIVFTVPGGNDIQLFGNDTFTIMFSVTVEPGVTGIIDVFYESNSGIVRFIEVGLPLTTPSVEFPADAPQGAYRIGAIVRPDDGVQVTGFADGSVVVVRIPTLTVTAPNTPLPLRPSVPGESPNTMTVSWTTNVPPTAGLVDVFARSLGPDGEPDGPEIQLLPPGPTSVSTAQFSEETSGVYEISVRLTLNDSTITAGDCVNGLCVRTAPQPVRVTSVPGILWLGSLTQDEPSFEGAIFEGIQNEDNAGSTLTTAGDLDGDGLDDFVVGARYGKPFFVNPSGIGPGEAYLIYGVAGSLKLRGTFNLNSVNTSVLQGVLLTGIQTVGDTDDTDGLSDITLIPDSDGDGKGELVFGFPRTNSAGNTVGPLEAPGQFLNGGVVILSSDNSFLREPSVGTPRIELARCGQGFSDMSVVEDDVAALLEDRQRFEEGACVDGTDGVMDTIVGPALGFIPTLAASAPEALGFDVVPAGAPLSEGICVTQYDVGLTCVDDAGETVLGGLTPGSGFYPAAATPLEPKGARIIGPSAQDGFGTSVTWSNSVGDSGPGDLIISAPNRSADPNFVDGISNPISNAGIAFLANNRNLWEPDNVFLNGQTPPTPHQYVMGFTSHCGDNRAVALSALRITGDTEDRIQNILGIDDFNGDARNDVVIGAPRANAGRGRVYVAFRREESVEGDFVLNKLELGASDPERLTGVLIVTDTTDGLGASLETGVDFNGDGVSDLVIGSPDASGQTGEVIVVFGDPNLRTPQGGIRVLDLLTSRNVEGEPRAARITGNSLDPGGQFGFNVANAGDVDGDGLNDLLISAPNASPRFDPIPTDDEDKLTAQGVDQEFPFGEQDDVSGPFGLPDGTIDSFDNLENAGIVYVILGSTRLDQIRTCSGTDQACNWDDDCDQALDQVCASTNMTINIDQLGSNQLGGFMIVGRQGGDRIGGGDAGDVSQGGSTDKSGRGRSRGLASAGDVDGDSRADILIGSVLADPRRDPDTGAAVENGGEAYLIYGSVTSSMAP